MKLDIKSRFSIMGLSIGVVAALILVIWLAVMLIAVIWVLLYVIYKGPKEDLLQFLIFGAIGAFVTFAVFILLAVLLT
ncbi:MAG: hypothetical protein LBH69_04940 [Methanomassiliicoccaceae archaeon]|nr:hypothetical protein [Methanomassiliicoccaceae archaeon]